MLKKLDSVLKNNKKIIAILAAALILRLLWIICIDTVPVSDFLLYHKGAVSILEGKGYRIYGYLSAYEPIGYSAFLAIIYFMFGSGVIAAKAANIVLSVIDILLIFVIAKKAGFNRKLCIAAALIYCILPIQIMYNSVVSTEILFTTVMLLITYVLFSTVRYKHIILGVLIGVSALIKPYMMIFQFLIFAYYIFTEFNIKSAVKNLIIITLFMACTIAPWAVRNYRVFHKVIPISTNGGYNLYVNNNPYATGAWQNPFKIPHSPLKIYKHANDEFWNEVKVDEKGKKLAYEWILSNPLDFLKVGLKKLANVFIVSDNGYWATGYLNNGKTLSSGLYSIFNIVTLLFQRVFSIVTMIYLIQFFIGIFKKHKAAQVDIFIFFLIGFYVAISFVFEGQPRYLFPLWPYYIIASVGVIGKKYRSNSAD